MGVIASEREQTARDYCQQIGRAMIDNKASRKEPVAAGWLVSVLTLVAFALSGVIWNNLTSQLTELGKQLADVRAENRILQTQLTDIRLSFQDLKGDVGRLVASLPRARQQ